MNSFRWGILATGNIAGSMAEALDFVAEADLVGGGITNAGDGRSVR